MVIPIEVTYFFDVYSSFKNSFQIEVHTVVFCINHYCIVTLLKQKNAPVE